MKISNFLIGLIICFSVNNIFASSGGSCSENELRFNFATVSLPPISSPVLVVPNGTIFNLTVSGSLKNNGDWDSTSVEIVGFSPICFSNTGSSVSGSAWTERINVFSLTAPSVTGIYSMLITMNKDDNCNGCNKQKTITFGVGILATGPQGPTGLPGEPGEDGQNGTDGTNGINGTDGQDGVDGTNGVDGQSCTVVENEDGSATVTCGEESVTIQPGQNGLPGENGLDCFDLNANGQGDLCDPEALYEFGNCSSFRKHCQSGGNEEEIDIIETNAKLIRASKQIFDCTFTEDLNGDGVVDTLDCNGQQGESGNNGTNGSNGRDGVSGSNGATGSSCSVKDNHDGTYTMLCTDGSYVTWHDGQDGADGQNGTNGFDGQDGQNGLDGTPGIDGTPCLPTSNDDGTTTITCGNNSFTLGDVAANVVSTPPSQGGICGSIDIITLLAGLAVGASAGLVRKH